MAPVFACHVCNKIFTTSSGLSKHRVVHSNARPHVCKMCGKGFKRKDHLNGHVVVVHSTVKDRKTEKKRRKLFPSKNDKNGLVMRNYYVKMVPKTKRFDNISAGNVDSSPNRGGTLSVLPSKLLESRVPVQNFQAPLVANPITQAELSPALKTSTGQLSPNGGDLVATAKSSFDESQNKRDDGVKVSRIEIEKNSYAASSKEVQGDLGPVTFESKDEKRRREEREFLMQQPSSSKSRAINIPYTEWIDEEIERRKLQKLKASCGSKKGKGISIKRSSKAVVVRQDFNGNDQERKENDERKSWKTSTEVIDIYPNEPPYLGKGKGKSIKKSSKATIVRPEISVEERMEIDEVEDGKISTEVLAKNHRREFNFGEVKENSKDKSSEDGANLAGMSGDAQEPMEIDEYVDEKTSAEDLAKEFNLGKVTANSINKSSDEDVIDLPGMSGDAQGRVKIDQLKMNGNFLANVMNMDDQKGGGKGTSIKKSSTTTTLQVKIFGDVQKIIKNNGKFSTEEMVMDHRNDFYLSKGKEKLIKKHSSNPSIIWQDYPSDVQQLKNDERKTSTEVMDKESPKEFYTGKEKTTKNSSKKLFEVEESDEIVANGFKMGRGKEKSRRKISNSLFNRRSRVLSPSDGKDIGVNSPVTSFNLDTIVRPDENESFEEIDIITGSPSKLEVEIPKFSDSVQPKIPFPVVKQNPEIKNKKSKISKENNNRADITCAYVGCERKFRTNKAMYGHLRVHPEREKGSKKNDRTRESLEKSKQSNRKRGRPRKEAAASAAADEDDYFEKMMQNTPKQVKYEKNAVDFIPDYRGPYSSKLDEEYPDKADLVWHPDYEKKYGEEFVDKFFKTLSSNGPANGSKLESGYHILANCAGNKERAMEGLKTFDGSWPPDNVLSGYRYRGVDTWTREQELAFEKSILDHGKEFDKVALDVPGKALADVVEYFYFWKKSKPLTYRNTKLRWRRQKEINTRRVLNENNKEKAKKRQREEAQVDNLPDKRIRKQTKIFDY